MPSHDSSRISDRTGPDPEAPDVLVPWSGLDRAHGPWPDGVRVHVWDGVVPVGLGAEQLARIGYWVMPYATPEATKLLPELPGLRAVQSLSAGVEKLRPLLPEGVALHNGRIDAYLDQVEHLRVDGFCRLAGGARTLSSAD